MSGRRREIVDMDSDEADLQPEFAEDEEPERLFPPPSASARRASGSKSRSRSRKAEAKEEKSNQLVTEPNGPDRRSTRTKSVSVNDTDHNKRKKGSTAVSNSPKQSKQRSKRQKTTPAEAKSSRPVSSPEPASSPSSVPRSVTESSAALSSPSDVSEALQQPSISVTSPAAQPTLQAMKAVQRNISADANSVRLRTLLLSCIASPGSIPKLNAVIHFINNRPLLNITYAETSQLDDLEEFDSGIADRFSETHRPTKSLLQLAAMIDGQWWNTTTLTRGLLESLVCHWGDQMNADMVSEALVTFTISARLIDVSDHKILRFAKMVRSLQQLPCFKYYTLADRAHGGFFSKLLGRVPWHNPKTRAFFAILFKHPSVQEALRQDEANRPHYSYVLSLLQILNEATVVLEPRLSVRAYRNGKWVLRNLLRLGCVTDRPTASGDTPLMYASFFLPPMFATALMELGVDVNYSAIEHGAERVFLRAHPTALHVAIARDPSSRVVGAFIHHAARTGLDFQVPSAPDHGDMTALALARTKCNTEGGLQTYRMLMAAMPGARELVERAKPLVMEHLIPDLADIVMSYLLPSV